MELKCPYCSSKNFIRKGIRKSEIRTTQVFFCKDCKKYFTLEPIRSKYSTKIILTAISLYNQLYSRKEVSKILAKKFRVKIPERTISNWINKLKNICTFLKIRKEVEKSFTKENIIFSQKLQHKQIYNFQVHNAKLLLREKELPKQKYELLKNYLEFVKTENFPHHIFNISDEILEKRASQVKANFLKIEKIEKESLASKLTSLALNLAKTNKERHQVVQNFMLINDSVTVACELPVCLTNDDIKYFKSKGFDFDFENYRTPITGHIDVLQIRNGLIYILDYKPNAEKINAVNQLTIYALALASRTKLAVKDFKCAWFDERNYFEFYPLHAVYNKA